MTTMRKQAREGAKHAEYQRKKREQRQAANEQRRRRLEAGQARREARKAIGRRKPMEEGDGVTSPEVTQVPQEKMSPAAVAVKAPAPKPLPKPATVLPAASVVRPKDGGTAEKKSSQVTPGPGIQLVYTSAPKPQAPAKPVEAAKSAPVPVVAAKPAPPSTSKTEAPTTSVVAANRQGAEVAVVGQVIAIWPELVRPFYAQPRNLNGQYQNREYLDWEYIKGLAADIKAHGQRKTALVIKLDSDPKFRFELVDGENRLEACRLAGVNFRAEVILVEDANEQFCLSVAANFGGKQHADLEAVYAIENMRQMGRTWEQICSYFSMSLPWIQERHRLLRLDPQIYALMDPKIPKAQRLRTSVAAELADVPRDRQLQVARQVARLPRNRAIHKVKKVLSDAGVVKSGVRGEKPSDWYANFNSWITRIWDLVDMALEIEAEKIRLMFINRDRKDFDFILKRLREIRQNLRKLEAQLYQNTGITEPALSNGAAIKAVLKKVRSLVAIEPKVFTQTFGQQPSQALAETIGEVMDTVRELESFRRQLSKAQSKF